MIKSIFDLSKKESIRVLGLMTGTSADGLDLACVQFNGYDKYPTFKVEYTDFIPYPDEFKKAFKRPLELSPGDIARLDMKLGLWYGQIVSRLNIEYDIIANHGQTLLHQAPDYTLQIGEAQCIRHLCNKPVIYDFRTADLVLGGQGAPLIPIVDDFLLRKEDRYVIALNMGGIANLSFLAPRSFNEDILAWDTGPANTLIDKAVFDYTQGKELFDRDGHYARSGKTDEALLEKLLSHPYFLNVYPKSAGQEQFGYDYYQKIKAMCVPKNDDDWRMFIRSISEMTIRSIAYDILHLKREKEYPLECVCSGGGANNSYIMERLQEELPECDVRRFDLPEIPADSKEAFGFAYLGYLFMRHIPGNVPSVTGSSEQCVLGKIVF